MIWLLLANQYVTGFLSFITGSFVTAMLTSYFGYRRQKTELSLKILEQFFDRHKEFGDVLGILDTPSRLADDEEYNRVAAMGDWFETVSAMCNKGVANARLLRKVGLDEQVRRFLLAVESSGKPLEHALETWTEMKEFKSDKIMRTS